MSKVKKMLLDLQKFAEGDEGKEPNSDPKPKAKTQQPAPQNTPEGKVFSEEYVKSLRQEAANYRVQIRDLEDIVKTTLGLEADNVNGDVLKSFMKDIERKQQKIIDKANERLLQAEIKNLEGYDAKLVDRLIDKSKVKITDDGEVEGLEDLVKELEEEFPQVKSTVATKNSGANPSKGADGLTEKQRLIEQHDAAEERGDFVAKMALMEKIKKLE